MHVLDVGIHAKNEKCKLLGVSLPRPSGLSKTETDDSTKKE